MTEEFHHHLPAEYRFEPSGRVYLGTTLRNTYNVYKRAALGWNFERAISVPAHTQRSDLELHLFNVSLVLDVDYELEG